MTPEERSRDVERNCLDVDEGCCRRCVEIAIRAAIEDEREACAKVCDDIRWESVMDRAIGGRLAAAIRARTTP